MFMRNDSSRDLVLLLFMLSVFLTTIKLSNYLIDTSCHDALELGTFVLSYSTVRRSVLKQIEFKNLIAAKLILYTIFIYRIMLSKSQIVLRYSPSNLLQN